MIHMRIVILGGGFAGLSALKANNDAIMIDNKDYFVLTHRLVDVVKTGNPDLAIIPYKKVFRATVRNIDFKNKRVITDRGEISYDKLIIALGYSQRLLPNTEKLETVEDALRIREKMLKARRVVILGGGLLGVELASLAREMNKETYLIEGQSKLLGFMSKDSSEYAKMKLEDMGVNILLNTKVDSIDGNVVKTNKDTIKADLIISSIGFKGPSLISDLKLSNVNDRMIVDEYLKSIDYDEVYGAGDCATNNKKFIPMSAQVAVQAGTRAMLNALGQEEKFSYKQIAIIAKIGEEYFGDFMGKFVKGRLAELAMRFGLYRAIRLVN